MTASPMQKTIPQQKLIKCVVWDLDNTLWDGVLLEDGAVSIRPEVIAAIRLLDERGILHSVASRNDEHRVLERLAALKVQQWLVCPQVNWGPKSESIRRISHFLQIGLDTFAFIDDDPFERAEVSAALPEVTVLEPADVPGLAQRPEMNVPHVTSDAKSRRLMYQAQADRLVAETEYAGSSDEFLASLGMKTTVSRAQQSDLDRIEELIIRTNQLNSTGYTYCKAELEHLCESDETMVLIARLTDRFGTYGTIALAVVQLGAEAWTVKLLLVSCRVLSRGIAPVLLQCIVRAARQAGSRVRVELIPNSVNRPMQIVLRFTGFREVEKNGRCLVLEMGAEMPLPAIPEHLQIDFGLSQKHAN